MDIRVAFCQSQEAGKGLIKSVGRFRAKYTNAQNTLCNLSGIVETRKNKCNQQRQALIWSRIWKLEFGARVQGSEFRV